MTYRDDNDELRSRVAKLEGDLAVADGEMARLRGERPTEDRTAGPAAQRSFGIPTRFERNELLPFEISEHGYEQIAETIRQRLAQQVSQVGRTLHAPGTFSLSRETGGTRIRMTGDWSAVRAGVVAGTFLALLIPGVPLMALFAGAEAMDMHLVALQGIWAIPACMVGGGWLMRKLGARQAADGMRRLDGAFEAVLDVARAHAVEAPSPARTRVDASVSDGLEDGPQPEAATSADARARSQS